MCYIKLIYRLFRLFLLKLQMIWMLYIAKAWRATNLNEIFKNVLLISLGQTESNWEHKELISSNMSIIIKQVQLKMSSTKIDVPLIAWTLKIFHFFFSVVFRTVEQVFIVEFVPFDLRSVKKICPSSAVDNFFRHFLVSLPYCLSIIKCSERMKPHPWNPAILYARALSKIEKWIWYGGPLHNLSHWKELIILYSR